MTGPALIVWLLLQQSALTGTMLRKEWAAGRTMNALLYLKGRFPRHYYPIISRIADRKDPTVAQIEEDIAACLASK